MKRTISFLLAFVLLLSIIPLSVFAADTPKIVLSVDTASVTAGSDVVLTVSLDGTFDAIGFAEFFVYYDSALFARKSFENGTAIPGTAVSKTEKDVEGTIKKISISTANLTDVSATSGVIGTITFTAQQDIAAETETSFSILVDLCINNAYEDLAVTAGDPVAVTVKPATVAVTGISLDQTAMDLTVGQTGTLVATVDPETATDKTVTWSSSDETVATVADGVVTALTAGTATITAKAGDQEATCVVTVAAAAEEPQEAAYTVAMGEDKSVVLNETVSVPVTVGHTADVTAYNAFDMSFSYDASVLERTSTEIEGMTVTTGSGTVRVQGYGADRAVGSVPFSLSFKAVGAGTANVTVTSAKVDISANAIDKDAPEATVLDATTTVTVSGYPVTLPEGFTGGSVAEPGEDYTFTEPEDYYDYEIVATVDGVETEVTENGDGTYTIDGENITGEIVITAEKSGQIFSVTLGTDMTGNTTAQYMADYTATLTAEEGYTYEVSVTIGGVTYAGYAVTEGVYTIPGEDITGQIVFTVTKTEIPADKFTVTFEGSAAGAVVNAAAEVESGANYVFGVRRTAGYDNVVTATMGGEPVEVVIAGTNGDALMYRIESVSGDLVITVEKTSTYDVAVSSYVELDGKTVFLVTATGAPTGKAFFYDGNAMFYSEPPLPPKRP